MGLIEILDATLFLLEKYVKKNAEVLDYGVGEGRLFPFYDKIMPKVLGYDIITYPGVLTKLIDYSAFTYYYTTKLRDDSHFDVVIAFSILTHIKPDDLERITNEIISHGNIALISAYNDNPFHITEDSYCFSHNYEELFKDYNIIETNKTDKIQYWVITKN